MSAAEPEPRWVGWRYWAAGRQDIDGEMRAVLAAPMSGRRQNAMWLDGEERMAQCWREDHPAPDSDCNCGYRITRRIRDLVAYMRPLHMDTPWIAFGMVEGSGGVAPGLPPEAGKGAADPPGTVRVEYIRLIGPLFLSPALVQVAVDFRRAYHVLVLPGSGTYSKWLSKMAKRPENRKQVWSS